MDGAVHTYKARLVAKGFTQTPRIDYEETFSLVADIRAIRILIAIVAFYDYEIWQMDVKTSFLNGYLSKEVYMEQPEGFVNPKFPNRDVKSYLGRCFAMKDLGEAAYILGIKIYRDRSKRLIGLCQSAYIDKILKRFYMENSKRGSIPMQEKLKLSKSQGASTPAEVKRMQNVPYASAMGSIIVSCYTDAGYLTDADDLKSQIGYVFVLNGGVVDWKSTKQSIFATSSAEDEYIVASDASKEAVIKYGDVKLEKVHTDDNLADPFTKALAFPKHSEHTKNIGMLPTSNLICRKWLNKSSLDLRYKQVLHVWISLFKYKSNAILNKVVIKAILGSDVKQHSTTLVVNKEFVPPLDNYRLIPWALSRIN
ncbi:retrotransposon protein, putative, ty1-copia subclass [Tanacetum coccineum]